MSGGPALVRTRPAARSASARPRRTDAGPPARSRCSQVTCAALPGQHAGMPFSFGLATTPEEEEAVYRFRYSVYVEEMGRYQGTADHAGRRLVEPEDDHSLIFFATDGDEVVATARLTWG